MKNSKPRSKNWRISRRESLKLMGGAALLSNLNPLRMLIEALADGFIRKAYGEDSAVSSLPRNLVNIGIFGAPPRWYWDLPLFPYSWDGSQTPGNLHVATQFSSAVGAGTAIDPSRYSNASYGIHRFSGIALPHLWSASIPTTASSTSTVAMTQLAQNMVILRGIRQVGDGHDFLHGKFLRPDSSGPSVHGNVADGSDRYLPAVQLVISGLDFSQSFSSRMGTALANGTIGQSPLDTLLSPFRRTTANPFGGSGTALVTRREAIEAAMNEALELIAEVAQSGTPGAEAIYQARSNAETFIREGLEDFSSSFPDIRVKYMNLIRRCADWSSTGGNGIIAGLTDKHISTYSGDDPLIHRYNQSNFNGGTLIKGTNAADADLRNLIRAKSTAYTTADAAFSTDTTYSNGMHEVFAVIEYLLKNGYSSSISTALFGVTNVAVDHASYSGFTYNTVNSTTEGSPLTAKRGASSIHSFDEHAAPAGGRNVSLLLDSLFFFQLSTCIYELKSAIGSTIYENTVIQVSSEFSRAPHSAGWGSEHAPYAGVSSLFSGAIDSPIVVGNTTLHPLYTSTSSPYYGYWGVGGKTTISGSEGHLVAAHVASTLAHLLRVESPTPNSPSLLTESGGSVASTAESPAAEVDE